MDRRVVAPSVVHWEEVQLEVHWEEVQLEVHWEVVLWEAVLWEVVRLEVLLSEDHQLVDPSEVLR